MPVLWNGSGDLLAAATADGLVDLLPGTALAGGGLIPFLPYVGHVLGQHGVLPARPPRP